MPEYTEEQIATMLADAKKGLFTPEDLEKKVRAEADRMVETGIQKGLETQRAKWEKDFSEKAKLSAEELAQKEVQEKIQSVTLKEQEIKKRANKLEAKEMLSEAQIPKAQYESLIGMLVSDDEETTKANVTSFINMFNATKMEIETKVKSELSKVPPPKTGGNSEVTTKEDFNKMGYADKMKFKTTNPEKYKEFMK